MNPNDDFIRLIDHDGTILINAASIQEAGIEWPPPSSLIVAGAGIGETRIFTLESYSQITDEQRQQMPNVARGALYRAMPPKEDTSNG